MSKAEITKKNTPPAPAPSYLSPEILSGFHQIDPALPPLIIRAMMLDRLYDFAYAFVGQLIAGGTIVGVIGGYIYLIKQHENGAAYSLLTIGVGSIIGLLLRNRLNRPADPPTETEESEQSAP